MDGFKGRLNTSIQRKLSFSLSLAILLVAVVAGVFSFVSAFNEAHELQDDTLRQVAALFNRQHLSLVHPMDAGRATDADEESRVIVQYLSNAGTSLANPESSAALPLPTALSDGLHTLQLGSAPFRVLVKTIASGERIAVAQETVVRDEIARNSALRTLLPFLILVPILLLLVANLVRKIFLPIIVLAAEIEQRDEQALYPVEDGHVPVEVRSFVVAINHLLARVAKSTDAQRRFVADAAHELRSPLTAISLQAERLAESEMSDLGRQRLATLRRGIERGRSLLDQLLTLAKIQTISDLPQAPISVQAIYRRVLEDLLPLADAKRIDIGVEGGCDAQVLVSELDLIAMVKNLVDNAIRYTPPDGRVDLSVISVGDFTVLKIQDNGPGIALAERARIFDPFYRALGNDQVGSGLGLSIVKSIADRIGAEIRLEFSDAVNGSGHCVSIHIARQ
jgi:two-component system OmpR family sensor kinase